MIEFATVSIFVRAESKVEMNPDQIIKTLSFIKSAENLKNTLRSGHTSNGRQESTADHSWRLCLLAISLGKELADIDMAKLLKICVIHDLGEAISGDVPATEQIKGDARAMREREDLIMLMKDLPIDGRSEILALWDEYEQGSSIEGRIAKGLDKLETIIQHNQGKNPADFDYQFNLSYGAQHMAHHSILAEIRAIVDEETRNRIAQQSRL